MEHGGAVSGDERPRGADFRLPVLADLSGPGPQAVAGPVVDDQPRPRLLGQGRRMCAPCIWIRPPMRWCSRSTRRPGCRPRPASTRPGRPGPARPERREFEYERHGTAVLYAGLERAPGRRVRLGHRHLRQHQLHHLLVGPDRPAPPPSWTCTHRGQPLGPHHREDRHPAGSTTLGSTCISPPPTPRGSTRWNCSSPSWSVACCAEASSARSTTWPDGSSPSSRTTTVEPPRSAGPTTADP